MEFAEKNKKSDPTFSTQNNNNNNEDQIKNKVIYYEE